MEVRQLQVEDVFTVARMLGKITRGARLQLASALTGKKTNPTELGMVLFQSLVTDTEEDLKVWLASLAGKELSEFKTMPATAVLDVIEGLFAQKGIKDFFGRASLLANRLIGKD